MIDVVLPQTADDALRERTGLLGRWRMTLDDDLALVRVLVRSGEAAEPIMNELESRFRSVDGFRIVLYPVGATLPRPADDPVQPSDPPESHAADGTDADPRRIACIELVEQLSAATRIDRVYVVTVLLSTAVAAIGLLRDNVAVVIGATALADTHGAHLTGLSLRPADAGERERPSPDTRPPVRTPDRRDSPAGWCRCGGRRRVRSSSE